MKEIILLGGPNGAAKTTTARVLLPEFFDTYPFLNADDIARGISAKNVEAAALAAGRQLIEKMRAQVKAGQEFCGRDDTVWQVVSPAPQELQRRWVDDFSVLFLASNT